MSYISVLTRMLVGPRVGVVAIFGAEMDAVTCTELKPEAALAKRWLRTGTVPLAVWQWLCGRQVSLANGLPAAPPLLLKAVEAFAEPLGAHSGTQERQALADCLANAAQVIGYCHQPAPSPAAQCQQRMLAASLLPLYRGLARGSVAEVTSVLRRQLADAVAITATLSEFHDELSELMCLAMSDDQSPYQKFKSGLHIDLELLSQVLLSSAAKWDGTPSQLNQLVREEYKIDWRPGWGQPAVLWRLAGELIAQRAEFVVPRDWIDVPVPWNEASEHWLDVVHALEQSAVTRPVALQGTSPLSITTTTATTPTSGSSAIEPAALSGDSARAPSSPGHPSPDGRAAADIDAAHQVNGSAATAGLTEDVQRLKLEIEIADAVDSLVQASRHATGQTIGNRSDDAHGEALPRPRGEEFVAPKIIIAEVRSHNDPAFVSVVRRQLAVCRSESRSMSLIAVTVTPEAEDGPMPSLQSLGLATWQQKLVNWLSDHPEINEPYAFVSNEGELILSLMDIERNTATLLLRQGLTKVLSGSTEDDDSLSRAAMPARYHGGIGSVAAPKPNFEPEQLIEATYRCLDAATRQGKASIKSIEVF